MFVVFRILALLRTRYIKHKMKVLVIETPQTTQITSHMSPNWLPNRHSNLHSWEFDLKKQQDRRSFRVNCENWFERIAEQTGMDGRPFLLGNHGASHHAMQRCARKRLAFGIRPERAQLCEKLNHRSLAGATHGRKANAAWEDRF